MTTITYLGNVTIARTICGVSIGLANGYVYPLTPCCEASGKGSNGGIVCRSCYEPVESVYAVCAEADNVEAVMSWIEELATCPDPHLCAETTLYALAD